MMPGGSNSAEIMGTHGNELKNDNPQFISHFDVYENYSLFWKKNYEGNIGCGPDGTLGISRA
jgi:hypothetical protein